MYIVIGGYQTMADTQVMMLIIFGLGILVGEIIMMINYHIQGR